MFRRINFCCFIFAMFISVSLIAENRNIKNSVGLYLGGYINLSGSNNGHVPSYYNKKTYEHPPSIIVGGYYERKLNSLTKLQAGVYYQQSEIENAYSVPDEDIHESTWGINAIHLPINLNISILKNQFYLILGCDLGLLLTAEIEGEGFLYSDSFKYNIIHEMPSVDRALVFGFGRKLLVNDIIMIIEGRYLYMLNDYTSRGITVEKKHNILFLVGIEL